jgi:hypothetical protein
MTYLPQQTIKYKTYIKTAIVEGLRPVFENHKDNKLQSTKVGISMPRERQSFPAVVVQLYENEVYNAGVGHYETFIDPEDSTNTFKLKHYMYKGDIEFMIYALSSLDRDLIADTIVQTIGMGDLANYTNNFFNRIYPKNSDSVPDSVNHFINVNSDRINPTNEAETEVPWGAEDDLIYTTSYRVSVWGEFYSLPEEVSYHFITQVLQYPYIAGVEPKPPGLEGEQSWNDAFSFD